MVVQPRAAAPIRKSAPVQPRAEETRQKLIAAAVQLFLDRGYVDVQPKEICRAAGLTTGAFYYHFQSKEQLIGAIVDEGMPKADRVIADFLASDADGLSRFIVMTFAVLDTINENDLQWVGYHLSQAIGHLGPTARDQYLQRVRGFFKLGAAVLQPAELHPDVTPGEAAEIIWMTMSGTQHVCDVLGDTGPAVFHRFTTTWRSTLRAIAHPDSLPRLQEFLAETAARYLAGTPDTKVS